VRGFPSLCITLPTLRLRWQVHAAPGACCVRVAQAWAKPLLASGATTCYTLNPKNLNPSLCWPVPHPVLAGGESTGEWHVGTKRAYDLFPGELRSRTKGERRKRWDEKQRGAVTAAAAELARFEKENPAAKQPPALDRQRKELRERLQLLRDLADKYEDLGEAAAADGRGSVVRPGSAAAPSAVAFSLCTA
jgi:hypothetical protein